MDLENPFYQEVIAGLNSQNVEYILIGGLAVGYHGYSRYTGDMDLWVNPTSDNIQKLYSALLALGYSENVIEEIRRNREVENPSPIKLWDDSDVFKVDLMTNTFQKEFTWPDCRKECSLIHVGDNSFPVVHINHLIRMKRSTKRLDDSLKDLVDAEELSKILKNKKMD